jgi:hypothetical protein
MGIDGLGTKSVVGAHLPAGQALVADLDHVGYQVNRENVLGVYSVLANEARRLALVMDEQGHKLKIEPCGGDPVSYDAERGFNTKLDNLRAQCNSYVYSLANAAERLKDAAQAYGYTEAQIGESLRKIVPDARPGAALADLSPALKHPAEANPETPSPYPRLPDTDAGSK